MSIWRAVTSKDVNEVAQEEAQKEEDSRPRMDHGNTNMELKKEVSSRENEPA